VAAQVVELQAVGVAAQAATLRSAAVFWPVMAAQVECLRVVRAPAELRHLAWQLVWLLPAARAKAALTVVARHRQCLVVKVPLRHLPEAERAGCTLLRDLRDLPTQEQVVVAAEHRAQLAAQVQAAVLVDMSTQSFNQVLGKYLLMQLELGEQLVAQVPTVQLAALAEADS